MSEPKRIQMRRTKGWRKPEGVVYVGRPSRWGNPFTLDMYRAEYFGIELAEARRMARSDFQGMLEGKWGPNGTDDEPSTYPLIDEIRAELAGRDLACWCPLDQPCHADVLLELANEPAFA